MAFNRTEFTQIYLKDAETDRVYTINVTPEEAMRLETGPQCLLKFSGLKRTYKTVKDHNNKSGNGTRKWPFLSHMENLLGSKPFMSPVSTISSTGKGSQSPSECSTSSIDSCLETEEKSTRKKFRQLYNLM
nr:PREDICTED: uncharacterized protein LOC105668519 [Linepithema humile]